MRGAREYGKPWADGEGDKRGTNVWADQKCGILSAGAESVVVCPGRGGGTGQHRVHVLAYLYIAVPQNMESVIWKASDWVIVGRKQ